MGSASREGICLWGMDVDGGAQVCTTVYMSTCGQMCSRPQTLQGSQMERPAVRAAEKRAGGGRGKRGEKSREKERGNREERSEGGVRKAEGSFGDLR